ENGLAVSEVLDIGQLKQTLWSRAASRVRMNVDFPSNSRRLQFFKNGFRGQRWRGWNTVVERVYMSLRSSRKQIHAVWIRSRHHWREPAVRSSKAGGHEMVIIQVGAVVVPHGP